MEPLRISSLGLCIHGLRPGSSGDDPGRLTEPEWYSRPVGDGPVVTERTVAGRIRTVAAAMERLEES